MVDAVTLNAVKQIGAPMGSSVLILDAPVNFTENGLEYLRTGNIKAYDTSYAQPIIYAPQLRVFGSDAKTYGTATGGGMSKYYYIGINYVGINSNIITYGSTLTAITSTPTGGLSSLSSTRAATNGTYLVMAPSSANLALVYTTNGSAVAAVGGTFTTFPQPTAICFGNNSWLSLSSINGTGGEQAYINNVAPTGAWTVGANASFAMTSVKALNYGAGLFVAGGTGTSSTVGIIITCSTVGGTWTDRTAASGIVFAASETIVDGVFDGTSHILVTSSGRIITSIDGINYVSRGIPLDFSSNFPLSGASSWNSGQLNINAIMLATDGAGTTVFQQGSGVNGRVQLTMSSDHGITWNGFQPYMGKAPLSAGQRSISYANGRWIENHSGVIQSLVDIGTSLTTPDYIGQQLQLASGQYVRIK